MAIGLLKISRKRYNRNRNMKPIKYTFKQANKIDLGTKAIYKYSTPTKLFDIAKMVVNGRHPKKEGSFIHRT